MSELLPRYLAPVVREALSESRVVALLGARQVGKSTLARQLISAGWIARYISLDDEVTLHLAQDDPRGFIASIDGPAVIDEIQRAPGLMLAIKMRVDSDQARGQFLITGSANLLALKTVQDALPGRVDYIHLHALAQAEIQRGQRPRLLERLKDGDVPSIVGAPVGAGAYAARVIAGGYPDAIARTSTARIRFFRGYARSLLDRELPYIADLRRPDIPLPLLNVLATRSAGILNVASLARDLAVDENTANAHLKLLEDLMLVRRIQPWYRNLGQRQIKAPKTILTDPGLLCGLLGASETGLDADPVLRGSVFETAVVTELMKLASSSPDPPEFFHYRDAKQREVDLVMEWPDGSVVAVEVKSGANVGTDDLRSLRYLRDKLGAKFKAGVIVNCGADSLPFGDRIYALPLEALWLTA